MTTELRRLPGGRDAPRNPLFPVISGNACIGARCRGGSNSETTGRQRPHRSFTGGLSTRLHLRGGVLPLDDPQATLRSRIRTDVSTFLVGLYAHVRSGNFTLCAESVLPLRVLVRTVYLRHGPVQVPRPSSALSAPQVTDRHIHGVPSGSSLPSARGVDDTSPPARWVRRPDLSDTDVCLCPDQGMTDTRVHRSAGVRGWLGPLSSLFRPMRSRGRMPTLRPMSAQAFGTGLRSHRIPAHSGEYCGSIDEAMHRPIRVRETGTSPYSTSTSPTCSTVERRWDCSAVSDQDTISGDHPGHRMPTPIPRPFGRNLVLTDKPPAYKATGISHPVHVTGTMQTSMRIDPSARGF